MGRKDSVVRLASSRAGILGLGVLLLASIFHWSVTVRKTQAHALESKGMSRFLDVFRGPKAPRQQRLSPESNAAQTSSPAGEAKEKSSAPPSGGQDSSVDALLRKAIQEGRDAEYIFRLQQFKRGPTHQLCPPLTSYSLAQENLSDKERAIKTCHERNQMQVHCVVPDSLFEPMRCPQGYEWDIEEMVQESERQWLMGRTRR